MRAPGILDLAPQREPRTFGKIVPMPDESRSKDVEEPTKPGRQKREFEGPKGEPTTRSSSTTTKGPVLRTPLATVSATARYQSRWSVGRNRTSLCLSGRAGRGSRGPCCPTGNRLLR